MENPELTELARLRTMESLHGLLDEPFAHAWRLADLDAKYPRNPKQER